MEAVFLILFYRRISVRYYITRSGHDARREGWFRLKLRGSKGFFAFALVVMLVLIMTPTLLASNDNLPPVALQSPFAPNDIQPLAMLQPPLAANGNQPLVMQRVPFPPDDIQPLFMQQSPFEPIDYTKPLAVWTTGRGSETAWDCPRDELGRQYAQVGDRLFIDWYNFSWQENGWRYMLKRLAEPNSAKVTYFYDPWGGYYMAGKQGVCDGEGVLLTTWTETPPPDSPVLSARLVVKPKMLSTTTTQTPFTPISLYSDIGICTAEVACSNISDQTLNRLTIEGKIVDPLLASGYEDLMIWANRSYVAPKLPSIPYPWGYPKMVPGSLEVQLPGSTAWTNPVGDLFAGGIPIGKLRPGEIFRFRYQIKARLQGFGSPPP